MLRKIILSTHSNLLHPSPPFSALLRPPPDFYLGGGVPAPALNLSTVTDVVSPHRIILPHGHHLYPSQNTEAHNSLHRTPTLLLTCLPCPCHACWISNAATLLLSKSILTYHSDASWPQFSSNTDPGAPPLPHIMYPCNRPPGLVATSPTPPLLPASCKYMLLVDGFLIS